MRQTSTRGSTGLLIIVIFAALVVIGGLLFSSGKEQKPMTDETTIAPPIATEERKFNIALKAIGDSIQMGEAVLRDFNGKTSVTAVVSNFKTTEEQPVQVYEGTCANPGNLIYSLTNLKQSKDTGTEGTDLGVSDTILEVSLDELLSHGSFAISVRKTPEDAHIAVACGEFVSATTTAPTAPEATTTQTNTGTTSATQVQ